MPVLSKIDAATLQAYLAEGLTPAEIARRLGVNGTTITRRMEALGLRERSTPTHPPKARTGGQSIPKVHSGPPDSIPEVHSGVPPELLADLWDIVRWWRERKEPLAAVEEGGKTRRVTYHVQERWIQAIQRASDVEHVSLTEVVNRAFRAYFSQKST